MIKHRTILIVILICFSACRPAPTATPSSIPTDAPTTLPLSTPTATPTPICDGCITVSGMRIYPGLFILSGKSTLPDGTCLHTQLFCQDEPLPWWPAETCVTVQDGTWQISVSLQESGAPYERPPEGVYTLVAWQEERRIASAMFWVDYSGPPTPSPTPPTAAPTATAVPSRTPTRVPPTAMPIPTTPPRAVLGISPSPPSTDTVAFVRQDGAVVLYALTNSQEQVLLDPDTYDTSGDNVLVTILFPARLSPDGQWLLVPTPGRGTWLTSLDGQVRRQVSEQLLSFTWAPDSRRIVFTRRGGQVESERDREVYVQDVVEGQEPRLLARLPDRAGYPAWSPGGDSAESVAAYSCESYACAIWLIDVSSGHVRELGQFAPLPMMATPGTIQWSPDGNAVQVSAHPGALVFPIDGGGPLPCASARGERRGTLSPDGALAAWAEAVPDADRRSRLTVARTGTDRQVTYDVDFEHVERVHWTDDGRRLLVRTYDRGQRLWTVDPAVGEPDLVAEHIFYLGTPKQLQQRSTQASAPVVTPRVLPEAGDPDTWRAYGVVGWPVCLRVPPTWRIGTRGDPYTGEIWEVTVANFEPAEQGGVVALTEALFEISFEYHRPPAEGDEPSLDQMRDAESRRAIVESTVLGDRQAIRMRPLVSPVSEEMRVQLDSGQLWITYQPLSSTQQVVLEQILAHIDLDPERPCPTPEPETGLIVQEHAVVSCTETISSAPLTPAEMLDLGVELPFEICGESTTWKRPTEHEQNARWWSSGRYTGRDDQVVKYPWTHDFFVMYGHGSITYDIVNLSGLWTLATDVRARCLEPERQDAILRLQKAEVWVSYHQVKSVRRLDSEYVVVVEPSESGVQFVQFARPEQWLPLTFHFVTEGGQEIERIVEAESMFWPYPQIVPTRQP